MSYKIISSFLISLFIYFFAEAQEPIQTDRPDQTESPFIVLKGFLQIETGTSIEKLSDLQKLYSHPSLLVKYGISERLELRFISELITEKTFEDKAVGLTPFTAGIKVNLWKEQGAIPLTSFIGHISFGSLASSNFKTSYDAPSFRFSMQHTLSKKISLGYNIGAEWNGENPEPTYIYTLTSGISITEKLGSYIELYGFLPQKSTADHRADAGFTYLLGNDFMVDISGGIGLTDNAPKKYLALGFSFRLNTRKNRQSKIQSR